MRQRKKLIRAALSGDRGKMGKSLKKLIKKSGLIEATAGANTENSPKKWPAGKIDGVIDFSLPPLFSQSLAWALKNKKPFVSGTTGLSARQKRALKKASQSIPVFYGENMSGGLFLLTQWLKGLFDASVLIEDIHHKNKKDRPSGTALRLKNSLPVFLKDKARIKSYRRGKEFGTHRLTIKTGEEILILEHQALSRELFAKGALRALLFILKKKKGYYGPSDLYGGGKRRPRADKIFLPVKNGQAF